MKPCRSWGERYPKTVVFTGGHEGGSSARGTRVFRLHGVGQKQCLLGGYRQRAFPEYWKSTYMPVNFKIFTEQSHLLLVCALNRHLTLQVMRAGRKDTEQLLLSVRATLTGASLGANEPDVNTHVLPSSLLSVLPLSHCTYKCKISAICRICHTQ